jgi:type III restriction enzyme
MATKIIDQLIINSPNGKMLVLEVKRQSSQQDATKRDFLNEWVRAVNQYGGFGTWAADVSFSPADLTGILAKQSQLHHPKGFSSDT